MNLPKKDPCAVEMNETTAMKLASHMLIYDHNFLEKSLQH